MNCALLCDYCVEYNKETKRVFRDEIDEHVDLCPDCQEEELETCSLCGALATHDGHTYCSDCY